MGSRRAFAPLLGALVALAWLGLWALSSSPYARYIDHGDWAGGTPLALMCRAIPAGDRFVPPTIAVLGWILMIAAMMLPSIAPLMDAFERITQGRSDAFRLRACLVAGYLAAWGAFGLAAHAAHALVLEAVGHIEALLLHSWVIGAATLALAGAFQFSSLKHRCLEKCRTPRSFVFEHWRGRAPARQSFLLGWHHGLFCVGCCWALMLLMFVVGAGSLGWMLALAAVMAVEKNLAWGRHVSTPLGIVLLAWAALLVWQH